MLCFEDKRVTNSTIILQELMATSQRLTQLVKCTKMAHSLDAFSPVLS